MSNQKAGGYLVDVSRSINGQPEYIGYDDFKPPLVQGELLGNQDGGGYYVDIGGDNIGGQAPIGRYNDSNPPIFNQKGGDLLNKKIKHLINYIKSGGNYTLPKYVLDDISKLN